MRKILKSADDIFVESDIEFSEGSTSYSVITTKRTAEKVKELSQRYIDKNDNTSLLLSEVFY